jgi:hypothetical protein
MILTPLNHGTLRSMDSERYSGILIRDLARAGDRFDEPAVRTAYAALVRALERFGEGELYEGEPLTRTQLAFMESVLPGLLRDVPLHSLKQAHRRLRNALLPAQPGWWAEPPPAPGAPQGVSNVITVGAITGSTVTIIGNQMQHAPSWAEPPGPYDMHEPAQAAASPADDLPPAQYDVFLSYSHRDGRIMRLVSAHLRARGLSVWTDHDIIPGTPSWIRAIDAAIQASAQMVVLATPNSKVGFVEKEVLMAQAYKVPIVPLLCQGDERTAIMLPLQGVQYLDCRDESRLRTGLHQLARHANGLKSGAIQVGTPLLPAGSENPA